MTETRTYAERRFTSEDGLDLYARDYAGADGQARLPIGPGIVARIQIQPVLGGEAALGISPGLSHDLGSDGWVFHPM